MIANPYSRVPPAKRGFQQSEHTWPVVTLYPHSDDPIVLLPKTKSSIPFDGRKESDKHPSIFSISYSKNLNTPSGSFVIQCKPSKSDFNIFESLIDDDWIDIVVYRNNEPYHLVRGLIDEIRRVKAVTGQGATSTVFSIVGRDFGKIFESTPIWFSPYYNELITQSVAKQVFDGTAPFLGDPSQAVIRILKGFLEAMEYDSVLRSQGVDWKPPKSMPGLKGSNFLSNINFGTDDLLNPDSSKFFQNKPKRHEFNLALLNPEGTLWALAQMCSDPNFTELYTDLLPNGDPFRYKGSPTSVDVLNNKCDCDMTVIMRDKPFPFIKGSAVNSFKNTWNDIPIHVIYPEELVNIDVGRSGYERYNAFFASTRIAQESVKQYHLNLLGPLVDNKSLIRHGMRRYDVQSDVIPDYDNPIIDGGSDDSVIAGYQRSLLRDWYCMNPYFLAGTLSLGHGRPEIKNGTRILIPGKLDTPDESYYVESMNYSWIFGQGAKSSFGVTRGWQGDDASYKNALKTISLKYEVPRLEDL